MWFSRSIQYTFQALMFMAQKPPGAWVVTRDIADQLNLPLHFLAKLMSALSQSGWLLSQRGKHGGYMLAESARDLSFLDILKGIDEPDLETNCLLGLNKCGDDDACVLHCQWQPIRKELVHYLGHYSLRELAAGNVSLPEELNGKL